MNKLKQLSEQPVAWVMFSLILAVTPHLPRFPVWSILLISVLFFWRVLCIKHSHWLPPKWILLFITIATCIEKQQAPYYCLFYSLSNSMRANPGVLAKFFYYCHQFFILTINFYITPDDRHCHCSNYEHDQY